MNALANRKFYTTRDILIERGYLHEDGTLRASKKQKRSAESRLYNLRKGEYQRRRAAEGGYRDNPTVLPPRLNEHIDWIEDERGRILYTERGRVKVTLWLSKFDRRPKGNA